MAFKLTVKTGTDEGTVYRFTSKATLGRTGDNDVVIRDASASRAHAKIFEKGGRLYIEDLGSANGTRLNATALASTQSIRAGDVIAIGSVQLQVTIEEDVPLPRTQRGASQQPSATLETEDDVDGGHGDDDDDEPPPDPDATKVRSRPAPRSNEKSLARSEPRSIRSTSDRPTSLTASKSAAQAARERRELKRSLSGRLILAWQSMSVSMRRVSAAGAIVVALSVVGGLTWFMWPRPKLVKQEVVVLKPNADPLADAYGEGSDVDVRTSDLKRFTVTAVSPVRLVGVLHYQAKGIAQNEVAVSFNGTELGFIPADSIDPDSRELEQVLPAKIVKLGEENELVFDNINNPPQTDAWKIWNIWIEIIPVPEIDATEAARRAKADIDSAYLYYERKSIDSENLFKSWKTYRNAWLQLESIDNAPPELLQLARTRMRELRPELDQLCNNMLVKYKSAVTLKPDDLLLIRGILSDIPRYFPAREHRCYYLGRNLLREFDQGGIRQRRNQ